MANTNVRIYMGSNITNCNTHTTTHTCTRTDAHTHTQIHITHTHRYTCTGTYIHTHTTTHHTLYSLIRVKCFELRKTKQKQSTNSPLFFIIIITCVIIIFPAPSLASLARSRPRSAWTNGRMAHSCSASATLSVAASPSPGSLRARPTQVGQSKFSRLDDQGQPTPAVWKCGGGERSKNDR